MTHTQAFMYKKGFCNKSSKLVRQSREKGKLYKNLPTHANLSQQCLSLSCHTIAKAGRKEWEWDNMVTGMLGASVQSWENMGAEKGGRQHSRRTQHCYYFMHLWCPGFLERSFKILKLLLLLLVSVCVIKPLFENVFLCLCMFHLYTVPKFIKTWLPMTKNPHKNQKLTLAF